MTLDEIIAELEEGKDYPANDPPSEEVLDAAITIIRDYQRIEQIYTKRWNENNTFPYIIKP